MDPDENRTEVIRVDSDGAPRSRNSGAAQDTLLRPWMVVIAGARVGDGIPLEIGEPVVLGRDEGLPLPLDDKSVSREHVEVTAVAIDEVRVRDLGSTNGTFVNGEAVKAARIGTEDRLQLGADTVLRVTLRGSRQPTGRRTPPEDTVPNYMGSRPVRSRGLISSPVVVGKSEALLATMGLAEQVAKTDSSVLIMGETGTGKELVARAIHAGSTRHDRPFIAVDLPAVPASLVESTLFGHVKGAYTGANVSSAGIIATAQGGTLFLDEIGDLELSVQAKLLRVLQERTYVQVGSNTPIQADFRLICATLRDIDREVQEKRFREDLLYRIDVVRIVTPPLRERVSDIEPLARSFLARFCERDGRDLLELSQEALNELRSYHWPGNVRELEHSIERAVTLTLDGQPVGTGIVNWRRKRDPFSAVVDEDVNQDRGLEELLADVERKIIADAMVRFHGNRTAVAAKLRIPRTTLRNKLKKHGLG